MTSAAPNRVDVPDDLMPIPYDDRVLVVRDAPEKVTGAGLYIPDAAQEACMECTVVSVGPGRSTDRGRVPVEVKVGQYVLVGKYAGIEFKYAGQRYVLVREDEVLCALPLEAVETASQQGAVNAAKS